MMGDVGKWQRDLADKLTVAVITRGSLEDNRNKAKQHNLTHVLMQQDNEVADAYHDVWHADRRAGAAGRHHRQRRGRRRR